MFDYKNDDEYYEALLNATNQKNKSLSEETTPSRRPNYTGGAEMKPAPYVPDGPLKIEKLPYTPSNEGPYTGQRSMPSYSFGTSQSNEGSDFSYENASSWISKYGRQIDDLYNSILNRDAFTYDTATDPVYQQYADQYALTGNRAMQDTLGEVSARTGGLASSYAAGAAQGSYDSYMQQLAAKVPELYQLAYSMYQNEGSEPTAAGGRGRKASEWPQLGILEGAPSTVQNSLVATERSAAL